MERLLSEKICLVTGAGRGIGRVIANQLASDGAVVYVADFAMGDMEEWAAKTAVDDINAVLAANETKAGMYEQSAVILTELG